MVHFWGEVEVTLCELREGNHLGSFPVRVDDEGIVYRRGGGVG